MNIIQAKIAALMAIVEANAEKLIRPNQNNLFGRMGTPSKHYRPLERQNHSKGESKARRKMAAKSRRINRRK